MSAASKNKEAAWYLIQWATSKQRLLDATVKYNNFNPTRKSIFDDADVQKTMAWGSGTYLPTVLDNLNKHAKIAYRPNPELPKFTPVPRRRFRRSGTASRPSRFWMRRRRTSTPT